MTQEQQRYSFSINNTWSTDCDGNNSHDYEVIAYTLEQVEKWALKHYGIRKTKNLQIEGDGEHTSFFRYKGDVCYSINIDKCEMGKEDYEYLKSGKYHTTVIDLTEQENQ
jgi:hypothetical protein